MLGVTVPDPISFLVMPRVWRATPLHPIFHRTSRRFPIDLDRADVGALRRALQSLQEGRVVGIFPEGPSSVRGRLEPGLPGVALPAAWASRSSRPGIRGTYEALADAAAIFHAASRSGVRFGPARCFSGDASPGGGVLAPT